MQRHRSYEGNDEGFALDVEARAARIALANLARDLADELADLQAPLCALRASETIREIAGLLSRSIVQERRNRHSGLIAQHFGEQAILEVAGGDDASRIACSPHCSALRRAGDPRRVVTAGDFERRSAVGSRG